MPLLQGRIYVASFRVQTIPKEFLPVIAAAETCRRVWGGRKIFRGPKFLNDVFWGKNVHFHVQKLILMTIFSHRPGFSDFDSLSLQILHIFVSLLCKMSYMTLSSQGKALFKK